MLQIYVMGMQNANAQETDVDGALREGKKETRQWGWPQKSYYEQESSKMCVEPSKSRPLPLISKNVLTPFLSE